MLIMARMLHDLLHPKTLVSPDDHTVLIEARFRDTLGFISASRQIERELRQHRYEASRRPQGYHIGMKLPLEAITSFLKSPWQRLWRCNEDIIPANGDYTAHYTVHDNTSKLLIGIASLQGSAQSKIPEIRVFVRSDGYRRHPENAFRLLAQLARDKYNATDVEIVTDRPQALSRYGFEAKDGKPLRRNAPNWMTAPIEKLLQP